MRRLAQKKKCLQHRALIVAWLRVNYCLQASGSIAKRDVFVHYIELCRANKIQPSSAASFGKILKMAFPTVKCNRVGPRGASKHHYRGLVLRDAYHLSLENVQPISDAAIAEMMKNMEEGDDHGDDDDDEGDMPVKLEGSSAYTSPTQQHPQHHTPQQQQQQQQQPPLYHSSSSSAPSSPHLARGSYSPQPNTSNGYYAQFMPPPPPLYSAYSLPQSGGAAMVGKPAFVLPPPQQQLHYMQHAAGGGLDLKKESFSWISPDMDGPTSRSVALQQPQQPQQPPPAENALALREWTEKRDLVEFCERNFQSLYDTILRGNGQGDSKDQVLTYVAEAWKNLRQYTRHMNLFPEQQQQQQQEQQQQPQQTTQQTSTDGKQGRQTADEQQEEQGKRDQDERYNQLGNDHEELKRKAMLDSFNMLPPQHFHQPLSAYHHQQQQQQQLQHGVKRPYADHYGTTAAQTTTTTTAPASSLHYAATNSAAGAGASPLLSLSGGASSLSLSWLNSMAFSVNNAHHHHQNQNQHRALALPSPTPLSGPNGSVSSYHLPSFASGEVGNRGSLEGLEYRSFEWKGVFE